MQLDQEALAAGVLSITRASGLFPDGLPFDIPDSDPAPAPKPLAACFEAGVGPADCLPGHSALPRAGSERLRRRSELRIPATLRRRDGCAMRPPSSRRSPSKSPGRTSGCWLEGENSQGISTLGIARISRTEAGLFQLDPPFVPPLLDISASDHLISIARRLVEILSASSSELAGLRRQKNQSLADFTSSDIANFWLLYTMNTHLPLLRHIFETRTATRRGCFP